MNSLRFGATCAFSVLLAFASPRAAAQSTAFYYQGQLNDGASGATGIYDFTFNLYSVPSGGSPIGSTFTSVATPVTNGVFSALVDFGSVYTGGPLYLQVAARTNASGTYTNLPRQAFASTPYAAFAITASNLSGTLPGSQLPSIAVTNTATNLTLAGSFSGSGLGLTNVWLTNGNTLASAGIIGTRNAEPFTLVAGNIAGVTLTPQSGNNIAVAIGTGSSASGPAAVAIGNSANSTGNSTLAIGVFNTAGGNYSVALGNNTVTGGVASTAMGQSSMATANYSMAAGYSAQALHEGTFVWADDSGGIFGSSATHQFLIRAVGGVGIGVTNPQTPLHVVSSASPTSLRLQSTGTPGTSRVEFFSNPVGDANEWREGFIQGYDASPGTFTGALALSVNGTGAANKTATNIVLYISNNRVGINNTNPTQALSISGGMNIDQSNMNIGNAFSNLLTFGGGSGEGIGSQRTASGNSQYDLVFYTDFLARMTILNGGNVGIGTTNPAHLLQLTSSGSPAYCDGTTWVNGSDRNAKDNFAAISPAEILEKVAGLPISQWKYKSETNGVRHIGPVAQDFHEAFQLNGSDDRHIATIDEEGVALAAIQALNEKLEAAERTIRDRDATIDSMEKRLDALERAGRLDGNSNASR